MERSTFQRALEIIESFSEEDRESLIQIVNPVVALNSALEFIKPLTIKAQPLNLRNPLDHPNSDL